MTIHTAFEIENQQDVTLVKIDSRFRTLDEMHIVNVSNQLVEQMEIIDPPFVVIDLSEVEYFGSSFLEVLFRLWNIINKREGELSLCGLQEHCAEVIHISHLDSLWKQFEGRSEAVDYLLQKINQKSS